MRRVTLIALCFFFFASICSGFGQDDQTSTRKIITKVQPQYPGLAQAAHVGGIVRVMARVNANGKVESVEVLGGHPLLAQAAVMAVSHWKWEQSIGPTKEIVFIRFSTPQ